jgi:hypothetical protein
MSAPTFPVSTIPGATTPQVQHAQMLESVGHQVKQATGETHPVEVVTEDSPHPLSQVSEFYDRAVLGRPGVEPSKSFLKRLVDRVRKKHPEAEVSMK